MPSSLTSSDLLARMKQLHPLMIDLSLDRIERLLAALEHPEKKLAPVVHIAGTNGKGSTLAFLLAMFEAAGKRVCTYTSPHLVRFHERIGLPGADGRCQPIGENALVDVLSRALAATGDNPVTFFEITSAAAFLAFAEAEADIVLLEVGLGGRYDTTNVITKPALSIITPVSRDHMDKLGESLADIAFEKAGILKSNVPAVIAQQEDEALVVIETIAEKIGASLSVWGRDFDCFEQNGRLIFQTGTRLMDLPLPVLAGRHQIRNAGVAIAAVQALHDIVMDDEAIEQGLTNASWPARLQRIVDGPLPRTLGEDSELWLDGGHNEAAGQALAQTMADLEDRLSKPLVLIVGMMTGKDARAFLMPFRGLAIHVTAVPVASAHNSDLGDSGRQAQDLAAIARQMGFSADYVQNLPQAVTTAQAKFEGPLRLLICGSLYLAGEALALQA